MAMEIERDEENANEEEHDRPYNSSVQNEFLKQLRRKQVPVEVYLTCGTCIRGRIFQYDNFSIRLNFVGQSEIIYKSAIATINPVTNLRLGPGSDNDRPPRYPRREYRRS